MPTQLTAEAPSASSPASTWCALIDAELSCDEDAVVTQITTGKRDAGADRFLVWRSHAGVLDLQIMSFKQGKLLGKQRVPSERLFAAAEAKLAPGEIFVPGGVLSIANDQISLIRAVVAKNDPATKRDFAAIFLDFSQDVKVKSVQRVPAVEIDTRVGTLYEPSASTAKPRPVAVQL